MMNRTSRSVQFHSPRDFAVITCKIPSATQHLRRYDDIFKNRVFVMITRNFSQSKHETWRGDLDADNLPKVKKRDGTIGEIDKTRGFVDYHRIPEPYRDPLERVFDWNEINYSVLQHDEVEKTVQAARCMDCGTPFCQTHTGCPVNNLIPEFNELVYKNLWREAIDRLHKTNNFPDFTGRVCPAPCKSKSIKIK